MLGTQPAGRATARPMTGSAKQSIAPRKERMDCFVADAPRNDGLTLRAEIAATLVAAVTVHAHPGDPAGALDPLPGKARMIIQRRRRKPARVACPVSI